MANKAQHISIPEARYLALHNQLLLDTHLSKTKKDLLGIIEKLGYIQIDTISIIERAHKHVLWTRFPSYKNEMLDELVDKDKKVFEFWDHAAAYMPMKYFRFTLPRKKMYAEKYRHWENKNQKLLKYIMDRITSEGPLQSRDFETDGKRGLWWDWKPAKDGLEYLFHTGKLMAKARKSFQKVYELPERILTSKIDTSFPDETELSQHLIMKEISANGFASEKEIIYQRHHKRDITKKVLAEMAEEKKIIPIMFEGTGETYYSTNKILKQLEHHGESRRIHILSPFDNIVIQRKRLKTLFNFEYVIECYIPAPKRKYGYFCMPVLYGDKFICRIDAKADRASDTLKIINIFWERDFNSKKSQKFLQSELFNKLKKLANFAGCTKIKY
jgi:uncharacterized protein YcaQ